MPSIFPSFPCHSHTCLQFPHWFSRYLKLPVPPARCQIICYTTPGIELQPQVQSVYDLLPVAWTLTFPCTFCSFCLWLLFLPASLLAHKSWPFSLLKLPHCTCLPVKSAFGLSLVVISKPAMTRSCTLYLSTLYLKTQVLHLLNRDKV